MINNLLRNSDKYRENTIRYNNRVRYFSPYIKSLYNNIRPYVGTRTNRIVDKTFDVTDKLTDIADIITR